MTTRWHQQRRVLDPAKPGHDAGTTVGLLSDVIVFLLLGLGTGSMYAALALGVVVVYRGTGVVNFALGAQAMWPAVVFAELRTSGDLILPVIGIADRYELGDPMGLLPAAGIGLLVGVILSVVAYVVVLRPLRDAPPLTVVVATVGLIMVLQALAVRSFGSRTVRTPSILTRANVEVLGGLVPVDRLMMSGLVLLVAIGLGLLYRFTRFGLATRAGASSEKGAILLGYNMAGLGVLNFAVAAVIVSCVGMLLTSLSGVNPFIYTVYVVPALAAALAGGLRSFFWAAAAGLGIGSFQALTVLVVSRGWMPEVFARGPDSAVPFLVIVIVLFLAGRTLPTRGVVHDRFRVVAPAVNLNPWLWTVMGALGLLIAIRGDHTLRLGLISSMWVLVLLLSMVVMTGYLGQISLAQLAYAGLAAFSLAKLTGGMGVPFPLAPLLAVAITTAVGTLIALPALRIRGLQFAIVTFATAFVFERFVFRSSTFAGERLVASVEPPQLFGIELGILRNGSFPSRTYAVITVVLAVSAALLVGRLRNGGVGRRFLAVRMNERAAAAAGISVVRQKLLGAAVSSFLAGVAGVMYGYKTIEITTSGLDADDGLQYVALAFLGGIGSVGGAVIGGLLTPSGLVIVALSSGHITENVFLGIGFGVMAATRLFPSGLAGLFSTATRAARQRLTKPKVSPVDIPTDVV